MLTSRLRGDDKPFTMSLPRRRESRIIVNVKIVYSHILLTTYIKKAREFNFPGLSVFRQ